LDECTLKSNLSPGAGFPLMLTNRGLTFPDSNWQPQRVIPRLRHELLSVCADDEENVNLNASAEPAYVIFQSIGDPARDVRVDVTLFEGSPLGREFVKTVGHCHPSREVYQVLHGHALWILYRADVASRSARDVRLYEAVRGELLAIEAGLQHVTINLGPGPLVLAAAGIRASQPDYSQPRSRRGAPIYAMSEDGAIQLRANRCYSTWRAQCMTISSATSHATLPFAEASSAGQPFHAFLTGASAGLRT
jgi:oxalate decarboxylase/phosphoglucose isomerase-like protein (cupin superfamily)